MENRPRGREQHVTGAGKDIYKRGDGLGTGPVGSTGGQSGRTDGGGSGGGGKRSGGRSPLMLIVIAAVLLLGGGGAGLSGLLGGGSGDVSYTQPTQIKPQQSYTQPAAPSAPSASSGLGSVLAGSFGGVSDGWSAGSNVGRLNTSVAVGSRQKYTTLFGGGQDTVTLMVYMCGTDLESKYGMGTADLQEMAAAALSDKVNVLVYTGGCRQWKNNIVSNSVNEIYKIENGGLRRLAQDPDAPLMTDPNTLVTFIQYCTENYPANRNMLIFWDHGGGSISGYGYDEKSRSAGAMSLSGIKNALSSVNLKFDFIGFDACLMATLENALMLSEYADYMIASEETEPGVGWYYTNWLTALSRNTSLSTLEIGKNIVDDFVSVCAQKCRGQDTTLSVVDLAELETMAPAAFRSFSVGTTGLVENDQFRKVSSARGSTREFAASNKIDQVDLIHFATNPGTAEGRELSETLLSAVKYNRTSNTVTNAYGLSVYFPYQRVNKVGTAAKQYAAIGIDDEYTRCIQEFASIGAAGQSVSSSTSGYAANPLGALLGGSGMSGGAAGGDLITQLLMSTLAGGYSGRSLDVERTAEYLIENQFDASQLVWLGADEPQIVLSEEQWGLVNDLALSVFYDDGEGFIDLGLDNVFSFTDDGALRGVYSGTWLAIDGQPIPYYHTGTVDDGDAYAISGYVPCLLNGERAELLLTFDNDRPYGYIAGARRVYADGETETVAKSGGELQAGDVIDFVCDYYRYDGTYSDSYLFGSRWIYRADAEISDVTIDASRVSATYRFTDIYGQNYWTPEIP